jgi:hypothetical protein
MNRSRSFAAAVATAVLVLIIAALSRAPYSPPATGDGVLRLAWRSNTHVQEICRPRTQAELDALPVHMRTPEACSRERAEYRLVLAIDAARADTMRVVGGGIRGDRPAFVMQERDLAPGSHRVRVSFAPHTAGGSAGPQLHLDTTLVFARGRVHLVTLDTEGARLIVRSAR